MACGSLRVELPGVGAVGLSVAPRARLRLLALTDERQRIAAELRKRCVATESDVLTALLADEIYTTKAMMFDELILDHHLAPRPGLAELMRQTVAAGAQVAVVTTGHRSWAEPLVRQLAGEGAVEAVVTGEDVTKHMPHPEAYRHALWELGICAEDALAVSGSAAGLRAANAAGLATVVITEGVPDIPAARCGPARLRRQRSVRPRGLPTPAWRLVEDPQAVGCLNESPFRRLRRSYAEPLWLRRSIPRPTSSTAMSTRATGKSPTSFAAI